MAEREALIVAMRSTVGSLAGVLEADSALAEAGLGLAELADRLAYPEEPWLVAVCGPTGAGKSHLVNYLAGGAVSPSGYRRPSTVAPVVVGPVGRLDRLRGPDFLPGYRPVEAPDGVVFDEAPGGDRLYLAPAAAPPWDWPAEMALIDTPDFDSVRAENEAQARDMARRADAIILVTHQAKYADQSTWDFLTAETRSDRPLLIILNRVTATAAVTDFQDRLRAAGVTAPVLVWPEEVAVGQVALNVARLELTAWLSDLGRRGRELVAASGRRAVGRLGRVVREELLPPLRRREESLTAGQAGVRRVIREWLERPQDRVALNLPGETREALLKNLGEMVSRSDLWAKPRRWLALPWAAVESGIKRLLGKDEAPVGAETKLADSLAEAGREALVTAVRSQARALAEAAGRSSPQPGLDYSTDEIREFYDQMSTRMDVWLKEEMERLLAGLPLGQKAAFYFVQVMHLGLVAGLVVHTGGLPGTETLVGGALGPVISKLTGALISRENLAAFEERAAARHQWELAAVFQNQGRRYQDRLEEELAGLAVGRPLESELAALEDEAGRVWP